MKKVTVPVGVPFWPLTVAVKVTWLALAATIAEETTAVELVWVSLISLEMDPSLVEVTPLLPLYRAEMFWLPGLAKVVCRVATPLTSATGVPIWVLPLKKVTVPVGVAPAEVRATVAVKVTWSFWKALAGVAVTVVVVFSTTLWLNTELLLFEKKV